MNCPRCSSTSILRNHDTVDCLACGHTLEEPRQRAWDATSTIRGGSRQLGPPWTDAERLLWRDLNPPRVGETGPTPGS